MPAALTSKAPGREPGAEGLGRTRMDKDIVPEEGRCVKCSTDYEMFKPFNEQRLLRPPLVAKITTSMKRRGFVPTTPIVVNRQMEIIDGQHRFQAAKNLGIPFYYLVDDHLNVQDVREMANASAAWSFDDYVTSHVRQGFADYKRLYELKELSGLAWGAFMYGCFPDANDRWHDIVEGRFNLSTIREAEVIAFLAKFEIFKPVCKFWTHRAFAIACSNLFAHPDYNHEQMKARLEYQTTRLVRCANAADYLKMLETIYNYRSHANNIIDFSRSARSAK